jgi:ketosteroid isomerase-like protein
MEASKSNPELVIQALTAYQQGDDETLRDLMHPDVEIYAEPGMINAGTFTGFEGFKQWTRQWEEAWEEISYEPVEFIEVDDTHLVVRVHVVGRGAGSGVETDREYGYLYEIEDGRSRRFHLYDTAEKAVEAARRLSGK